MVETTESQIEALEQQRVAAIGQGDVGAMDALLADDYVHVNSTGRVIDKAKFLSSMAGRARATARGPLTVHVYGDTAVILGSQSNRTEQADKSVSSVDYVATQVVRRVNGRWQFVLMQMTQKAPKGAA